MVTSSFSLSFYLKGLLWSSQHFSWVRRMFRGRKLFLRKYHVINKLFWKGYLIYLFWWNATLVSMLGNIWEFLLHVQIKGPHGMFYLLVCYLSLDSFLIEYTWARICCAFIKCWWIVYWLGLDSAASNWKKCQWLRGKIHAYFSLTTF